MSRRRAAVKREVLPDPLYGNLLFSRFINCLMKDGKKGIAETIFYGALQTVSNKIGKDALEIFKEAVSNVRPALEVRSRRVGGATYQVPMDVRHDRSFALAIRWIINASRNRSEKTMQDRLAGEILDALNSKGASVKKREDTHKMAEANRAFAHYRW